MNIKKIAQIGLFASAALVLQACGGDNPTAEIPATQTKAENFSGNWTGSYSGTNLSYFINQSGRDINIIRTSPALAGLENKGIVTGNVANVIGYINGINSGESKWTITNGTRISILVTSCNPPPGYSCAAPGTTIILNKQL